MNTGMGTTPRVRLCSLLLLTGIFTVVGSGASKARLFDAHVGLGPRVHDEATGGGAATSVEGVAVVRAAFAIAEFLDVSSTAV